LEIPEKVDWVAPQEAHIHKEGHSKTKDVCAMKRALMNMNIQLSRHCSYGRLVHLRFQIGNNAELAFITCNASLVGMSAKPDSDVTYLPVHLGKSSHHGKVPSQEDYSINDI
jgi:hypothetical protein